MRMIGPRLIDPAARVLQTLYVPVVLLPLLIAIAAAHWWLYVDHGLVRPLSAALTTPGALFGLTVLILVSSVFHELGHAAALRYGGGRARSIGVGFYLLYPIFYTDSSDAYRLGRWARLRTDLGGFYFDLVFALGIVALYRGTGQEFLLMALLLADLDILRQCLPFVRMDGYWALADLTGVPDFFSQLGPFLRSFLPTRIKNGSRLPPLRPLAKAVFLAYAAVTPPLLAVLLFVFVRRLPSFVGMTWNALLQQVDIFWTAQRTGDLLMTIAATTQVVFLSLPLVGVAYLLYRMGGRLITGIWALSKPTAKRRIAGTVALAGLAISLGLLWAPQLALDELPFIRPAEPARVQHFQVTERAHVQGSVDYPQIPPVGGNHAPIWQNCGFYDVQIASEHAVHSMEHGAVWITYRSDLPADQIGMLRNLAQNKTYVLVSPMSELPAPVVASAWGRQLLVGSADDPSLKQFVGAFWKGEQAPESGGPCTGGVR
jgi:hypothetical protein